MFHLYLEHQKNELKNACFLQIQGIMDELEKLKATFAKKPHTSLAAEATYLCDTIKPQMVALRAAVDKAEGVMEASIYPYPTYEQMIYSHHFWGRFCHLLSYFALLFWVDDIDVYPLFGTWKWIFPNLWGSADWGFDLWHLPPILPLLSVERCRKCPWKSPLDVDLTLSVELMMVVWQPRIFTNLGSDGWGDKSSAWADSKTHSFTTQWSEETGNIIGKMVCANMIFFVGS